MEVKGQHHTLTTLMPAPHKKEHWYPLNSKNRKMGWPQSWSGWFLVLMSLLGFKPQTSQSVAYSLCCLLSEKYIRKMTRQGLDTWSFIHGGDGLCHNAQNSSGTHHTSYPCVKGLSLGDRTKS